VPGNGAPTGETRARDEDKHKQGRNEYTMKREETIKK
jgi:hypothetical protein